MDSPSLQLSVVIRWINSGVSELSLANARRNAYLQVAKILQHQGFDKGWTLVFEGVLKLIGELPGGGGAGGRDAQALGDAGPIEVGVGNIEHVFGFGSEALRPRALHFDVEDAVAAVGED